MSEGTSYRCVRRLNEQPKSSHSFCGKALANVSVCRPPCLPATLARTSTASTALGRSRHAGLRRGSGTSSSNSSSDGQAAASYPIFRTFDHDRFVTLLNLATLGL